MMQDDWYEENDFNKMKKIIIMKRLISVGLCLITCICLVAQTTKTYTLTFDRNDFTLLQTENGYVIESDKHDLRLEEDFSKPAIPYVIVNILLPDMQTMKDYSFNVVHGEIEDGIVLSSNPNIVPTNLKDQSDNNNSLSYPKIDYPFSVDYANTEIIDNYRIVSFKVFPLSYDSNQSKITWASKITLNITTFPIESNDIIKNYQHRGNRNELLQDMLLNPEEISASISSLSMKRNSNFIDYIIITSSELKPAFQLLSEWKNTKGLRTKIITIDEIYANYTGSTEQLKIKNCINHFYTNYNTEYVLLGGDDNILPVQRCYASVETTTRTVVDSLIPTDLFYACLKEPFDWNPNGDSYIGHENDSINLNIDVFLTRVPVRTLDDAYAFVDKLLVYEQAPPETIQMTSMLLSGVEVDEDLYLPNMSSAHGRGKRMNNTILYPYWSEGTVKFFFDTGTDFDGSEQYDVNVENLQEQLGRNFGYHFIQMDTHGDQCSWYMESGVDYSSFDAMELESPISSIILTSSCTTNHLMLTII